MRGGEREKGRKRKKIKENFSKVEKSYTKKKTVAERPRERRVELRGGLLMGWGWEVGKGGGVNNRKPEQSHRSPDALRTHREQIVH